MLLSCRYFFGGWTSAASDERTTSIPKLFRVACSSGVSGFDRFVGANSGRSGYNFPSKQSSLHKYTSDSDQQNILGGFGE